jgi:cell division protein FtsN
VPQPTMIVIAAGLSIVGAAIGVNMGRAAVDQINPANFKDSDPPFYSDMVPNRPRGDWAQVQAQEYRAASQATAPQGCAGCTWPVAPDPPQQPEWRRVERYTRYPVEREREPVAYAEDDDAGDPGTQ